MQVYRIEGAGWRRDLAYLPTTRLMARRRSAEVLDEPATDQVGLLQADAQDSAAYLVRSRICRASHVRITIRCAALQVGPTGKQDGLLGREPAPSGHGGR
jgi:hypothetical protein